MPTPNTQPKPPIDFDTGARGVSYFRKELAAVRSLLPKLLLQHLQLNAGRVITRVHLPTDLPDNFDWGLEPAISTLQWEFAQEKLADFFEPPTGRRSAVRSPFRYSTGQMALHQIGSLCNPRERCALCN